VSIYKHEPLARLGFMHLIATNMCVWMGTLINEIMEESNHILTSINGNATVHMVSSSLGVAQPFLLQNNTTQSSLTSTSQYFGKCKCFIVFLKHVIIINILINYKFSFYIWWDNEKKCSLENNTSWQNVLQIRIKKLKHRNYLRR